MKIILKHKLLITALLIISSCGLGIFKKTETPYLMGSGTRIPIGTPIFQKGFVAGCTQSLYVRGNLFYRLWYKPVSYDPKYNDNGEYRFGYKRGINACFFQAIAPKGMFPYKESGFVAGGLIPKNYNGTSGMFDGLDSPFGNGGDVNDAFATFGSGSSVFSENPLWAGGSKGQFFGQ